MATREKVVTFASEPGFWTGHWKNVALQMWGGVVTVARIDRCDECNREVLRAHPNRLVTVAVILSTANPKVGSAERKRVEALTREQQGITLAAAQIVDGTGFWASAVRAVLTGFNMLSNTRQKVFDADADAVLWLVGSKFVAGPPPEVEAALAEARRMYAER